MSDPRLQDGSAGTESRSARTPEDVRQQLYASLTSACFALDELEHMGIGNLRHDEEYIAKIGRLMAPVFASPASAASQTSRPDQGTRDTVGPSAAAQAAQAPFPPSASCTTADPPILTPGPSSSRAPQTPARRREIEEPIPELRLDQHYDVVISILSYRPFADKRARGYLVNKDWWDSWVETCTVSNDPLVYGAGIRFTMNPIDNTSLVDASTGLLREGLKVDEHFVVVSKAIWENCFVQWYREPSHVLTCNIIHSDDSDVAFDLYGASGPVISESNNWELGSRWMLINNLTTQHQAGIYAVSNSWWTQWRLHEDGMPGFEDLGPIDNSDLFCCNGCMIKRDLGSGSYVRVPLAAWHLLKTWFGSSTMHDAVIPGGLPVLCSSGCKGCQVPRNVDGSASFWRPSEPRGCY